MSVCLTLKNFFKNTKFIINKGLLTFRILQNIKIGGIQTRNVHELLPEKGGKNGI